MNEQLYDKIEKALSVQSVFDSLDDCASIEEAQELFKENGIELSEAEMIEMCQIAMASNGELDENDLEAIAGGGFKYVAKGAWDFTKYFFKSLYRATRGDLKTAFKEGTKLGRKYP